MHAKNQLHRSEYVYLIIKFYQYHNQKFKVATGQLEQKCSRLTSWHASAAETLIISACSTTSTSQRGRCENIIVLYQFNNI